MRKLTLFLLGAMMASFASPMLADDDVVFVSQPVLIAQVGRLYEYDADAISRSGGSVTYELRDFPAGMTIDASTGLVRWTPALAGSFRVKIRAEAGSGSPTSDHADQEYTLRVLEGRPGKLRGAIRNAGGQGISTVRLRLFETGRNHFLFTTSSDSLGRYSFPAVSAGTYLLRAEPRDNSIYASQWYDRAQRVQDATPIVIPESSIVTIAITLFVRDSLNAAFNLSGNVSDTANAPIRQARVSIFRARQNDDLDNSGMNFEGLDNHHRDQELETSVLTDSVGNYHVRLRPRRYIVLAEKDGYAQQFWDHEATALDADRLNLVRDTSGIDFDLRPQQVSSGVIAGRISSGGDTGSVRAHVIGFHRATLNGNFSGFTREVQTDGSGRYALEQLRSGYYIVLAVPHGEFVPTFYDTTGGTILMARAFPVPVAHSLVNNINIRVQPDTVLGMNRVRGVAIGNGVPLAGTIVYAASAVDGSVGGAAVSERNGAYTIVGLAHGTYVLHAAKPGFTQPSVPVISVDQHGATPTTVLQSVLLSQPPTGVDGLLTPFEFTLKQNYPNPFNPTTKIGFQITDFGFVSLKVFDMLGREVATLVNENLNSGSYETDFNAGKFASGVYYYTLQTNRYAQTRKMILLR